MRVRGLKLKEGPGMSEQNTSHPMRVRGLKPKSSHPNESIRKSHPMRVRGLKLLNLLNLFFLLAGRTPCGCVD